MSVKVPLPLFRKSRRPLYSVTSTSGKPSLLTSPTATPMPYPATSSPEPAKRGSRIEGRARSPLPDPRGGFGSGGSPILFFLQLAQEFFDRLIQKVGREIPVADHPSMIENEQRRPVSGLPAPADQALAA